MSSRYHHLAPTNFTSSSTRTTPGEFGLAMEDQKNNQIYPPHLQANLSTLVNLKFLIAIFSGATAGVLGVENLNGFLLFGASILLNALLVILIKCGGKPGRFVGDGVSGGLQQLLLPGMDNMFGFILTWTLFYGEYYALFLFVVMILTHCLGIVHGMVISRVLGVIAKHFLSSQFMIKAPGFKLIYSLILAIEYHSFGHPSRLSSSNIFLLILTRQ